MEQYILRGLVVQKWTLAAYGVDFELPASLSVFKWALTENIVTIFDPCEQLTRNRCSATYAHLILYIKGIKHLLNKTVATAQGVKTSKSTLLQAIDQRFAHIHTKTMYYLEGVVWRFTQCAMIFIELLTIYLISLTCLKLLINTRNYEHWC